MSSDKLANLSIGYNMNRRILEEIAIDSFCSGENVERCYYILEHVTNIRKRLTEIIGDIKIDTDSNPDPNGATVPPDNENKHYHILINSGINNNKTYIETFIHEISHMYKHIQYKKLNLPDRIDLSLYSEFYAERCATLYSLKLLISKRLLINDSIDLLITNLNIRYNLLLVNISSEIKKMLINEISQYRLLYYICQTFGFVSAVSLIFPNMFTAQRLKSLIVESPNVIDLYNYLNNVDIKDLSVSKLLKLANSLLH
jgi:hypothetical protein